MPRRCRPLRVAGFAIIVPVAAMVLVPTPGHAQAPLPDNSTNLLQPTFDGNPNNPQRFRSPGTAQTASGQPPTGSFSGSATSAVPVYGSPTGFGAGNTGFVSSNTRRKRVAQGGTGTEIAPPTETFIAVPAPVPDVPSIPPPPKPLPPPEIHPAKAASRQGAVLQELPGPLPISNPPQEVHPVSSAIRRGAVLAAPPPLDVSAPASAPPPGTPQPNTLPLGTASAPLPIAGIDPYAALGIRAGSFLILPSIDLSAGYDTNPQHVSGGPGSSTYVISPELQVRSDWLRHAFSADIIGAYYLYGSDGAFSPPLNRPYFSSKLDGRIDVTRDTQILLENRVIVSTDNPGSPNIAVGLAKLPIGTTVGGTVGVAQQFSRFDVSLKGSIDRSMYQNSDLVDGESVSNDDRNFDQYAGILRVGYEVDPGLKPFVEVSEDKRVHDVQFDVFNEDRDSTGSSAKVGGVFNFANSFTGEMAVGYLQRVYQDPTLPNISGMTLDGSLIWQATPLTTAKFIAASSVGESTLQGVSGSFSRDFSIQVDHALRRWLIATVKAGYGHDEYVGLARDDNRYFGSAGLTYKLNREMQLKGELRHDWLTSTATGVAYQSTSFILGLHLQR